MNDRVDELNEVISDAVMDVYLNEGINAVYVPVDSYFDGHGLCDTSWSWLNNVSLKLSLDGVNVESYHPNNEGWQLGYGMPFLNSMS